MNWNDVKYFIALYDEQSVARTARKMGVDATTVMRRIRRLETYLGGALFLDKKGEKVLSALGFDILQCANELQINARALEIIAKNKSKTPAGNVIISATLTVARHIIMPALKPFSVSFPNINIDLTSAYAQANLPSLEADIALRMYRPEKGAYKIRKIGNMHHNVYGKLGAEPNENWVGYSASLARLNTVREIETHMPNDLIRFRSNDPIVMVEAVAAGLGNAVLPSWIGDHDPRLVQIKKFPDATLPIWMVMREDVARLACVRVTADWLVQIIGQPISA